MNSFVTFNSLFELCKADWKEIRRHVWLNDERRTCLTHLFSFENSISRSMRDSAAVEDY